MTVTGNITDKTTGEAMSFANVYISDAQGNSIHLFNTTADGNGKYGIPAEVGQYLGVSFIGYKTQVAKVTGSTLNFMMSETTPGQLNEVEVKAKKGVTRAQVFAGLFLLFGLGYVVYDFKTGTK